MSLQLDHVRTFLALVQHGGFHAAAAGLGVSQAAVSQQLQKLEGVLGVRLFDRSARGAALTPEGHSFLPYARSLTELSSRALRAVRKPILAVGASSNVGTYLLHRPLRQFIDRNPHELQVFVGTNQQIAAALERNDIDVAAVEWWAARDGYVATPWCTEALVVIVPPGHPMAAQESVSLEQLKRERIIGGEAGTGTASALRAAFGENVRDLDTQLTLGSTEAVKRAVREGLGVSIVFAAAVEDEVRHGHLRALSFAEGAATKTVSLVLRKSQPSHSPAKAFADFLLNRIESEANA